MSNFLKVGSASWKDRYVTMAASFGFGPDMTFTLDPAVEQFYLGELDLFDAKVKDLGKACPRLENTIQDYRCRVADPVFGLQFFEVQHLPMLRKSLKDERETIANLEGFLRQRPELSESKEIRFFTRLKELDKTLETLEKEATKNLEYARRFALDTMTATVAHEENRKLLLPVDYLRRAQGVRDNIYRTVATKENILFLGWDMEQIALYRENLGHGWQLRSELYNDLKGSFEDRNIGKEKMKVLFPMPLGEESVEAEKVFEELMPQHPSVIEQEALGNVIRGHFKQRRDWILKL